MNPKIKAVSKLLRNDILDLLHGDILALRIYPFESEAHCKKWQECLNSNDVLKRYSNAPDVPVNRIGMTLFETENKPEKISQYLEKGQQTQSFIREIFGKRNPLDELIEKVGICWEMGCEIQKIAQQPMNPGIIRSFEASLHGGLPPHIDSLLKDLPDSDEFKDMQCQLAANLYFEVSDSGGELELWNYAPNSMELEMLFTGDYDFIDRIKIPVLPQKLKPKQGELILFRSNCIHSVTQSEGGMRSAASCFIGFYNRKRALTVWA